ncbi:MAG: putative Ig domain-containing protein, partial [Sediminibacterium sp.]|nr:putative Ig domain-containing protein [Sediminibacterium sp.]
NIALYLSNFTYSSDSVSIMKNTVGNSGTPTITGFPVPTFSISPVVPGVTINANTGVISWSSLVNYGIYTFTVTAANSFENIRKQFKLRVYGDSIKNLTYNQDTLVVGYFGTAGNSNTPTRSPGNPPPTFSFSETSPTITGISINANTGVISWTSTPFVGIYTFSVVATNITNVDSSVVYRLQIKGGIKPIISYLINSKTGNYSIPDSSVRPTINATGFPIRYKIISEPINGISIDSISGVIKWTNRINPGIYSLIVQAKNSIDTSLTNYTIKINPLLDTAYYFSNSYFQTTTNGANSALSDYISLPSFNLGNNFTIETWFKLDGISNANYPRIFDFGIGGNLKTLLFLDLSRQLQLIYGNTPTGVTISPAVAVNIGVWNHYALTVNNGNNLKLYMNGVLIFSGTN